MSNGGQLLDARERFLEKEALRFVKHLIDKGIPVDAGTDKECLAFARRMVAELRTLARISQGYLEDADEETQELLNPFQHFLVSLDAEFLD